MFLNEFIQHLREHDRAEGTISAYVEDLGIFIQWYERQMGQAMEPDHVVALDVRAYKAHLQEDCWYSPATVNRKLSSLKTFLGWCVESGLCQSDPAVGIHTVEEQETAPRWLTRVEQRNLMRVCEVAVQTARTVPSRWRALRDQAIVAVMLHGGLRIQEVAQAKMESLTLNGRSGSLKVIGKGNKQRTVALNKTARKALAAWLAIRGEGEDSIFLSQKGGQLDANGIYRRISEYGRKAGIEGMTPHSLRHSCAKNLVDRGAQLSFVAVLLGHSRLDTTAIYTKPSAADLATMVEWVADEE